MWSSRSRFIIKIIKKANIDKYQRYLGKSNLEIDIMSFKIIPHFNQEVDFFAYLDAILIILLSYKKLEYIYTVTE